MQAQTFQLPSLEQLVQVIQDVLSGDNQKIQTSTKFLKVYTKQKECVPAFLEILEQSPRADLKQMSVVMLKRNIITLYELCDAPTQQRLKNTLLTRFFQEQNPVRTALGALIGLLATVTVPEKQWPELFTEITQKTDNSQEIATRQAGLQLLGFMIDSSGDFLDEYYEQFYNFFRNTINDQNATIKRETVKCLAYLFASIYSFSEEHIKLFQELIPPMMQVLDVCLAQGDEDIAYLCFDVFNIVAESNGTLLDNHLPIILNYVCSPNIILNKELSKNLKNCMIDFIYEVSENKRKVLSRDLKLLKSVVDHITLLAAQPLTQDDLEEAEDSIQDSAVHLIEVLTTTLPKKKIFNLVFQNITELISSDVNDRVSTGFVILAGICEGCAEQLKTVLQTKIMDVFMAKGLASEAIEIRGAAIKALSYMAEYLMPDIVLYHKVIIPALVSNFSNLSSKVAEKAMIAIDIFCENMEKEIIQYLPSLIPQLVAVVTNPQTTNMSKMVCVSAIGSCITSAQEEFKPYVPDVSKILQQIILAPNTPDITSIQSQAISSLAKISANVCKTDRELYTSSIAPIIEHVYNMMTQINDYEIKEAGLTFFYHVADTLQNDFASFLPNLIDFTLNIITSESGLKYEKKQKQNEFSLDTDSEDEDMNMRTAASMNVKMTYLDEKAAAIHAIGTFAQACPVQFTPHFERTILALESCHKFFYENVRIQSVVCYKDLAEAMVKCSNNGTLPVYKKGEASTGYDEKVKEFLQIDLMNRYLDNLETEESSDVVAVTIESIGTLLKSLGPVLVENCMEDLVKHVEKYLRCQGTCQIEDSDDEDEDTMIEIFENLTDLIPDMAKVLKNAFLPSFEKLVPAMMLYTSRKKDINDNIQIVGAFAEVFKNIPAAVGVAGARVAPVLLKFSDMCDDALNRNVCYCLGVMCQNDSGFMAANCSQVLIFLMQIFRESVMPEARENAISALCRLIIADISKVPVDKSCLDNIFGMLPFKSDKEENKCAVKFALYLCDKQSAHAEGYLPQISQVLVDGLANHEAYKIRKELYTALVTGLKALANNDACKKHIEESVMSLDESKKEFVISQLR